MKSYREELWFETKTRRAYVNITPEVDAVVRKSGVREGMVLVNAMHITASVYINEGLPLLTHKLIGIGNHLVLLGLMPRNSSCCIAA